MTQQILEIISKDYVSSILQKVDLKQITKDESKVISKILLKTNWMTDTISGSILTTFQMY